MISKLSDVTRTSCKVWRNGMGHDMGVVLAVHDKRDGTIAVATGSWHVDYDYITWPAIGDHADDWLAICHYGDYPPNASKLRAAVEDFLHSADLSPLDDNDDDTGHAQLATELLATIQEAQ